jgi:A/G-specific adenine glycosylase
MLQQTQVKTVLPHFERFLARFPTVQALAAAADEEVRAAWSGLGYYRRARSLHASARALIDDHGGRVPGDMTRLRELPGVGSYTAAALASIVHDVPAAVVDGNVIRVLARVLGIRDDVTRADVRRRIDDAAQLLLNPATPGNWNQAMMELGALVCTPKTPRCGVCPWKNHCTANAAGNAEDLPLKPAPRATRKQVRAVGVLRRGDRVLLVRRRDPKLLDGTWELPGLDLEPGMPPAPELARALTSALGRDVLVTSELARVQHAITHRRITVQAFAAACDPLPRAQRDHRAWVDPEELGEHATSSMTTKVLGKIRGR